MLAEITNLWQFMSDSPILTFFLALIIGQTIIYAFKYSAYAIRGKPNIVQDDDEDDE